MFDDRRVTLGDGVIEVNVFISPVEPPAGHLVPIAVRPLLNYLAPFVGEGQIDRLVLCALRQTEGFLRARVLIRDLAG